MKPVTDPPPSHPYEQGTVIAGRYTIDRVLGSGGIAHVYRAVDAQTGKAIALKMMSLSGDPSLIEHMGERFKREARIVNELRVPGIVQMTDYGFGFGPRHPYIAMELLDGHDLDVQVTQHGPLDVKRGIRLVQTALDAVGEAHDAGVIHKDLKPANLFLANPGRHDERLVVLDFGGATAMWDERITQLGKFMGTPKYLAPEYIETHTVTPALDVYQMALVLVFLLTGQAPVQDVKPLACADRHLRGDLIIADELREGAFGEVLAHALAISHLNRFPHARAFATALRGLTDDELPDLRLPQGPPPSLPMTALQLDAASALSEWSLTDALRDHVAQDAAVDEVPMQANPFDMATMVGGKFPSDLSVEVNLPDEPVAEAAEPWPPPGTVTAATADSSGGLPLPIMIGGAILAMGALTMVIALGAVCARPDGTEAAPAAIVEDE